MLLILFAHALMWVNLIQQRDLYRSAEPVAFELCGGGSWDSQLVAFTIWEGSSDKPHQCPNRT